MELQKAEDLAKSLIEKSFEFDHYKYSELSARDLGYTFKWSNKKRALGSCNYKNKHVKLSKCLTKKQDEGTVRNTILHEIAHAFNKAIYNMTGHGHTWRKLHKEMGGTGNRVTSLTYDKCITDSKYTLVCPSCGNKASYHRRIRVNRSCASCDPSKYNEKFKMELIQNW